MRLPTNAQDKNSIINFQDLVVTIKRLEVFDQKLKTKIKIGTQKVFDDKGELKSETAYKYQDKVKAN